MGEGQGERRAGGEGRMGSWREERKSKEYRKRGERVKKKRQQKRPK